MRVTILSGFQPSGSKMLEIENFTKLNKLVKKYIYFKIESVDLFKQHQGIQKCNKMGGFSNPTYKIVFEESL
jgi:hypothetical protein